MAERTIKTSKTRVELVCKADICVDAETERIVVDLTKSKCPPDKLKMIMSPLFEGRQVEWKLPEAREEVRI